MGFEFYLGELFGLGAARQWGMGLGTPRALGSTTLTAQLERVIARWVKQERALVFTSTTHLALDALPALCGADGILFADAWAYPITMQGAAAAVQRGAQLVSFPHNDFAALARLLHAYATYPNKVIVCDGVYAAGGGQAALAEFARLARAFRAVIYVDDAHGLGVLGAALTREMLYGFGGGGLPQHQSIRTGNVIHAASFSKALGVPLAFAAGPAAWMEQIARGAASHVHSSPPALPLIAAAHTALAVQCASGEARRAELVARVRQLGAGLAELGIEPAANEFFPIQTIRFQAPNAAARVGQRLWNDGIWAYSQTQPHDQPRGSVLCLIVTARHTPADIRVVLRQLGALLKPREVARV